MLIARGRDDDSGVEALILGLSRGNIERLLQGKPIRITRATHGDGIPENWLLCILFGETEQAIADELAVAGLLNKDVEVHRIPADNQVKRHGR